ncbi:MAG: diguanylate cyclase domain-containing protein [Limnothrix sp. BL-A-16]|jgi:diguanylate cyclase (GGDEF)-like protein
MRNSITARTDANVAASYPSLSSSPLSHPIASPDMESSRKHYSLLIVDDTPDNVDLLRRYLMRFKKFRIQSVENGQLALEYLQNVPPKDHPDLILMDVVMPKLNGFETYRALQTLYPDWDVPVIFMTGLSDLSSKLEGLELGAVDYIIKPFQKEEVLARIELQLRLLDLTRQLRAKNEELEREVAERQRVEATLLTVNLELERLATSDGLTQVANRRCFDTTINREWQRLAQDHRPMSLVLCDVDYFKRFNDHYGHQAGDDCLIQVARTLQDGTRRATDLVARYGGEEFAILLPDTDLTMAVEVIDRLRRAIENLKIPHERSEASPWVTVSLGLACQFPKMGNTPQNLIAAADAALYEAKQQGRNTYCKRYLLES